MKAGSQVELSCKCPALPELAGDLVIVRKLLDLVAVLRMRLEGQNLAVDPKATDLVLGTETKGGQKRLGVRQAKPSQFREAVRPIHPPNSRGGRVLELD